MWMAHIGIQVAYDNGRPNYSIDKRRAEARELCIILSFITIILLLELVHWAENTNENCRQ